MIITMETEIAMLIKGTKVVIILITITKIVIVIA